MSDLDVLRKLTSTLNSRNAMPEHTEVAQVGSLNLVNVYNKLDSEIISNNGATGLDSSLATATLKALTEFFERNAFTEGAERHDEACLTERSDGFAAYPIESGNSKDKARNNSLNEAIERYVWSTWWDDTEIKYDIEELEWRNKNLPYSDLLSEVDAIFHIKAIKVVRPHFDKYVDKEVLIIFAELSNGGVLSGGGCGGKNQTTSTVLRSLGELARHALGLYRIRNNKKVASSFYEKRLELFGSLAGESFYKIRMSKNGNNLVNLPSLKFDNEIPHSFSDIFYAHRCLFENQPPFIGGSLERFCL